jgi:hypothetical protein
VVTPYIVICGWLQQWQCACSHTLHWQWRSCSAADVLPQLTPQPCMTIHVVNFKASSSASYEPLHLGSATSNKSVAHMTHRPRLPTQRVVTHNTSTVSGLSATKTMHAAGDAC